MPLTAQFQLFLFKQKTAYEIGLGIPAEPPSDLRHDGGYYTVNSHTVLDGIITTIMATIQRINIIGSREGSRNRRRLKANQTGKKFRVGIKSNISTNRNNLISGVDRCIQIGRASCRERVENAVNGACMSEKVRCHNRARPGA